VPQKKKSPSGGRKKKERKKKKTRLCERLFPMLQSRHAHRMRRELEEMKDEKMR
jgi:hypothetical protein